MLKSKANIATKKKYILLKISFALLILLILLSTATYTWFEISKTPKVSDMMVFINATNGIELSYELDDEDAWGQHIDYRDLISGNTTLKPVTYSYDKDCFYAANFGIDGRIKGISEKLRDDRNTNRADTYGYYVKIKFYARTDENVSVSLLDAEQKTGTYVIGAPKWNGEELIHVDGGRGAQYAVRIGFRVTPLDSEGIPKTDEARFIIYEPNSTNYINYNGDYIAEYIETPSIDEGERLVPKENLIRQTSTLWNEMDTVQMDLVEYKYGEFLDDTTLFTMKAGEKTQIELYMWLEGQDVDCTNLIGHESEIFSSIQFFADVDYNSGMEEIE